MTIHRIHQQNTFRENVQIWEGDAVTGKYVGLISGKNMAGTTKDYEFCVEPAVHTLLLDHYTSAGWGSGSYFQILVGGVEIMEGTLDRLSLGAFKLYRQSQSLFSLIASLTHKTTSTWRYSDSAEGEWYSAAFGDSSWTVAAPGSFAAVPTTTITRYYRASIELPEDLTGLPAYEIGVYTKYGFIVYVNGVEVSRGNLPDTVTADTPCSATSDAAAYRRISLPVHTLPTGTLVIAVEIHFSDSHAEEADEFAGFFTFVAASSIRNFGASYDSNHEIDVSGEGMANAFDNDFRTKWTAMGLPAYNTIIFDNDRSDFINTYSIASSGGLATRRPTKWTLAGSNDGEEWTVLDKQDGVYFNAMYQPKEFTMAHNAASFKQYRFTFEAAQEGTNMEVGRINLMVKDVTYVETPVLSYPAAELFLEQTNVYVSPTQGGFHTFTISPTTLPAGLTFSSDAGTISGTPTAVASASTYVISAQHSTTGTTSYSYQLSLSVIECSGSRVRVDIVKHDTQQGSNEYWTLKQGETVIDSHHGLDIFASQSVTNQVFSYCLNADVYTLTLGHDFYRGWYPSAYIEARAYISSSETVTLLHHTLLASETEPITVTFSTVLLSTADLTSWTYKADGTVPDGWYSTSFTGTWDSVPATAPTVAQKVWLFRRQITVSSITGYNGFVMRSNVRGGVVVYLNGAEVFRTNVDGTISSSSTATSSETSPVWRTFSGHVGTGYLIAGQNTFAVAVVNSDASSLTMDAAFVIHLLAGTSLSLGLETTVADSHHNSDSVMSENLFYGDYSTRWQSTWADTARTVTATFKNGGKHIVNHYCMVASWDYPMGNPKGWTVLVSTDGSSFVEKVTENNIQFPDSYSRLCFYLPGMSEAVRAIRFSFSGIYSSTSNLHLDAIDLYLVDTSSLTIPSFNYASTFTLKVGADVSDFDSPSMYYYDFSITPDLPTGLILQTNGKIRGRPVAETAVSAHILSAKNINGDAITASFTLTIEACGVANTLLTYSMGTTGEAGHRMQILMTLADGSKPYYNYNIPNYSTLLDMAWCMPKDVFTFVLLDQNNGGWASSYTIEADGDSVASGSVSESNSPKTITVATLSYIIEGAQTFKYLVANIDPPTGWYLPSTTLSWPEGVPGTFPNVESITSFYCTSFTAVGLDLFAGYRLGIKTRGGFVAYLNGEEINRVRLSDDALRSTPATQAFTEPTWVTMGMGIQASTLIEGDNYLCVEVHKATSSSVVENEFDVYLRPAVGGDDLVVDGTYTYSHAGYNDGTWFEEIGNAVDKNTSTKFYSNDATCTSGGSAWLQWTYNNERKEFVTRFTFYTGNDVARMPKTLRVQGSNDGSTWETVMNESNSLTSASYGTSITFNFLPTKAYHHYRFEGIGCTSQGIEVGEFYIYNYRMDDVCSRRDGISAALEGTYSTGPCPDGYTGTITYLCSSGEFIESGRVCTLNAPTSMAYDDDTYTWYTKKEITPLTPTCDGKEISFNSLPKLPTGISLDSQSGVISGKPTEASSATRYSVFCKNEGGTVHTVLNITVIQTKTPVWVYIVIVIVAVIVIAGIVVAIVFAVKKKGTKGKKGSGKKTLPKTNAPKLKETAASKKVAI